MLVTHDISEAIALSDRVLVFTGRPARLKRDIRIELLRGGEPAEPFERRGMERFNEYFDLIWGELEGGAGGENSRKGEQAD